MPISVAPRSPAAARNDDEGRRVYTWNGRGVTEEFYSVTTMLGLGVPKFLVPWAVKLVSELVTRDLLERGPHSRATAIHRRWAKAGREYVKALQADGGLKSIKLDKLTDQELALRYLKGEPDRVRDFAAERGKSVHAAAEDFVLENLRDASQLYLTGETLPDYDSTIAPHMAQFGAWLKAYRPVFEAVEATVFNRSQVYAGTLDVFAWVKIRGQWRLTAIDYKSGNFIWPEVAMQCCAYARGEFIGSPDRVTELPVPTVAATAVLHITPTGYTFRELRYDDVVWTHFLYVRETFRWAIETSKTAIGDVIQPDIEDDLVERLEAIPA